MNCNRAKYDVHAVYADCSERTKAKEDNLLQGFRCFVVPFCTYMVNNGITGTVLLYNGSRPDQTVIIFICELNH